MDIYSLVILHLHTQDRVPRNSAQTQDLYYTQQADLPRLRPVMLRSAFTLGVIVFFGAALM